MIASGMNARLCHAGAEVMLVDGMLGPEIDCNRTGKVPRKESAGWYDEARDICGDSHWQ